MAYLKDTEFLRFIPSTYGSDTLLLVQRGCAAEEHIEVFSAHTTNQPDEVSLQQAVDECAAYITTAYQSMINVVSEMQKLNAVKPRHESDNQIMNSFFKSLVFAIATRAETIFLNSLAYNL